MQVTAVVWPGEQRQRGRREGLRLAQVTQAIKTQRRGLVSFQSR